jgi:nucleolar protein 14
VLFLNFRKAAKVSIETKNPRFQIDYKMKKDFDPDASRVKLKQLTREKKREHKAAMRELRRDSDFLDQERTKEKQSHLNKLREERHKNYAWMEEQQATINEQVRKGGGLMKGGGTGMMKKVRVKRK